MAVAVNTPSIAEKLLNLLKSQPTGDSASPKLPSDACSLLRSLESLRESVEVIALVSSGPPEDGSSETWASHLCKALTSSVEQDAAYLEFQGLGGFWAILEVLSSGRAFAGPRAQQLRQSYYGQLAEPRLLALLLAALEERGPSAKCVRLCMRNLARCPQGRSAFEAVVPQLVANLEEASLLPWAAPALCNVACASEGKRLAVASGGVQKVLSQLQQLPDIDATLAEDLVACLGVFLGGSPDGMKVLFECADTKGEVAAFGALVSYVGASQHPSLQSIAIDVLGSVCAAAPQSQTWLVEGLPLCEGLTIAAASSSRDVCKATLEFCSLLANGEAFKATAKKVGLEAQLRLIVEREPPPPPAAAVPKNSLTGVLSAAFSGISPALGRGPIQREPTLGELAAAVLRRLQATAMPSTSASCPPPPTGALQDLEALLNSPPTSA